MKTDDNLKLYQKTVSAQSYWPYITAPTLFLGASNDFNSPTELIIKSMNLLPSKTTSALALAPHLNHRFTTGTNNARFYWMESHLKNDFLFPANPNAELKLNNKNKIPFFSVTLDPKCKYEVDQVKIYYGFSRDPRIRFWRTAKARKNKNTYSAFLHIYDQNEPLFAFANVTYKTGKTLPARPGVPTSDLLTLSSNYFSIHPDELKKSGIKSTSKNYRTLDDFTKGMQDWYILGDNNPQHWFMSTRKVIDPSFMGPQNATLRIQLTQDTPGNSIAIGVKVNTWQGYTGRKPDEYVSLVDLSNKGKNIVSLKVEDFINKKGQLMKNWDELTELYFTPANKKNRKSKKWTGKMPKLHKIEWLGGLNTKLPYPHEKRNNLNSKGNISFDDQFQQAIDDSVLLEKNDKNLN
ncbi:hypothetical protein PQO03_17395 [Lentisphaera profundi]|uniref:Uncharacterized protein n=1 Tax=Lentisphaera profundi TaxID=1658616 RepID=A0ABY7VTV2_9BACT|nr:hypothetical protein [Lentisphaera profundi]WDE97605.1 hypothetical protein PQO03_17395 [Lentisphaera profundi]